MKKLAIMTVVVALCGTAQANLRVFGSYWDGGDLQEGYGAGVGLRAELLPVFAIDMRGSRVTLDELGDVTMTPIEVAAVLQFGDNIVPYAGLGGGYYLIDAERLDPDDELGIFAMAGIELGASEGLRLFAEVRWVALEAKLDGASDALDGLTDETVSIDGIGINAGIVWDW